MPSRVQIFLSELSRRRVMRVVATYAIGTFGALQSADVIVSALGLPHYLMTGLVVLTFVGLPVTAALAWVFDLTPEGVVRTAPLPAAGSPSVADVSTNSIVAPRRSRLALVLGALALLLGAVGAVRFWQVRHRAPLAADLVAVLPFSVGGSEQYSYLREGMAELLSAGISGGGALRCVDGRTLARAIKESGGDTDSETGHALARRFGAGLFVVGNVLEVKDRLRIHAQLFDANQDGTDRPIADATAEGNAETLFAMVDDLLRQMRPGLVENGQGASGSGLVALAQTATKSLPALKAFIEGESALREGNEPAALKALQGAVAQDPDFALAQYRLAVVSSWTGEIPLGRAALYHALRNREKLPPPERELIEAFSAYWRGQARQAEELYRAILAKNPDDAETWYQLGEVLYHDGPFQGRPEDEAKSAFERAAALEPNQRMYSIHLDQIARREGDRAALAKLDELQLKLQPNDLATQWEHAWATGDLAKQAELEKKLDEPLPLAAATMFAVNDNPNSEGIGKSQTFLDEAIALPQTPAEYRASFKLTQSQLLMMGGKRAASNALMDAQLSAEPALYSSVALRSLLPFLPHTREEQTQALATLAHSLDPSPHGLRSPIEARMVHDYLEGRLAAALGDTGQAEKDAQALSTENDSDDSALGQDLALAVRAFAARAKGNDKLALELLEKQSGGVPLAIIGEPHLSGESERWLHGELLANAGRFAEALRWFESTETNTVNYWLGPTRMQRAQLLERLGKKKEALDQYRLFVDLWKDADVELKPLVEDARSRMAVLAREQVQ